MASLMESMDRGESEMYESVFQRVYTAEGMAQGMAQGIAQGMAQGIAQGRVEGSAEGYAKGRTEVARNMLRKGFSVDSVVECTTLPREEVESLANL
ncbi:MAG: hypothetical protein LBR38_02615, partial [Synergistaceae bacterium]|jgi:predicted transposase/invertase (TIGR01784 family)|nr:hypothetical protein [Synergistaceae bacterium]